MENMSARRHLLNLYQTWRELSETEGEAIRQGAWSQVDQAQVNKSQLQVQIITAAERLQKERGALQDGPSADDKGLRGLLAELIQLEYRNGEWLAAQRRQAEHENEELSSTARNLKQVHRAYAMAGASRWESYS